MVVALLYKIQTKYLLSLFKISSDNCMKQQTQTKYYPIVQKVIKNFHQAFSSSMERSMCSDFFVFFPLEVF